MRVFEEIFNEEHCNFGEKIRVLNNYWEEGKILFYKIFYLKYYWSAFKQIN